MVVFRFPSHIVGSVAVRDFSLWVALNIWENRGIEAGGIITQVKQNTVAGQGHPLIRGLHAQTKFTLFLETFACFGPTLRSEELCNEIARVSDLVRGRKSVS